jgi:hypothetical protein
MRVIKFVPKYQPSGPPGLDVVSVAICTLLFIENRLWFETSPFRGIIERGRNGKLFRALLPGPGRGLKHGYLDWNARTHSITAHYNKTGQPLFSRDGTSESKPLLFAGNISKNNETRDAGEGGSLRARQETGKQSGLTWRKQPMSVGLALPGMGGRSSAGFIFGGLMSGKYARPTAYVFTNCSSAFFIYISILERGRPARFTVFLRAGRPRSI